MTLPLMIGVAASFLAGSFGYILFQFWLRPMLKYRRVKRRVAAALAGLPARGDASGEEERRETFRQLAVDLSACHNDQLPDWYRLLLRRRRESPLEAAAGLMKLSNTRRGEHAVRQAAAIRGHLNLGAR